MAQQRAAGWDAPVAVPSAVAKDAAHQVLGHVLHHLGRLGRHKQRARRGVHLAVGAVAAGWGVPARRGALVTRCRGWSRSGGSSGAKEQVTISC